MSSTAGKYLVASPYLEDPNFLRTVVLVLNHDAQSAFGLVVNRPSSTTLAEAARERQNIECDNLEPIFIGGPVEGALIAVHDRDESNELVEQLGVSVSFASDNVWALVADKYPRLRVYEGFSGWGPGQLEAELEQGSWFVVDAPHELLFGDTEGLWHALIRSIGHEILTSVVPHLPSSPEVN